MKALKTMALIPVLALTLAACGKSGSSQDTAPETRPKYTSAEYVGDTTRVEEAEAALAKTGLKFQKDFKISGSAQETIYTWDRLAINNFTSEQAAIEALENYKKLAGEYLAKYSKSFILVDGAKSEGKVLMDYVQTDYKLKIELCDQTLKSLKSN
jgi:ABC-type glycerol-3-phosphate transport system substrate-binding protein